MIRSLVAVVAGVSLAVTISAGPDPARGFQVRDAAQPKTGTAVIRGRITAADSGRPLRRARVSLFMAAQQAGGAATAVSSNAQGLFEITNLAAGLYRLSATRAGYLAIQYGQRRPGETGRTVEVRDGQVVERIDIALPRGGVMAGRITDERGEPYPAVRVEALSLRYHLGRRVPSPAGVSFTDDRGQFRISSLLPGAYYVMASSRETWQDDKKDTYAYAFTYFPGVGGDHAESIDLAPSQERADLDFRLSISRAARVTGYVRSATGEGIVGETVSLAQAYRGTSAVASTAVGTARTEAGGAFEISNVPPGEYRIGTSTRRPGGASLSVSAFVSVTGDVKDIILVPRGGRTINGSIVTDADTPPDFAPSRIRMVLVAVHEDRVLPTVRLPGVNPDWSFRLTNIGGPFLYRVSNLPDDWMLKAIRLNDEDITDVPYDVAESSAEMSMHVVLTQKVGSISGLILDANGTPTPDAIVVIFADDEKLWMPGSRFVRATRPGDDGRFTLAALPPGAYRAIAREFIVEGQWEDPEFLERTRRGASTVELVEGKSETITLRLPARR